MAKIPPTDDLRVALIAKLKWMIVGSGSEPRALGDQLVILAWIDRAIDALAIEPFGIDANILRSLWEGHFDLNVVDGEVRLRLTTKGHEVATTALMNDPEMRHFYQSLVKGAAVDEPKGKQ